MQATLPASATSDLLTLARFGLIHLDENMPALVASASNGGGFPAIEVLERARVQNRRYRSMLDELDGRSVTVVYERAPYDGTDVEVG